MIRFFIFINLFIAVLAQAQEQPNKELQGFLGIGLQNVLSTSNLFNDLDYSFGPSIELGLGIKDHFGLGLIFNQNSIKVNSNQFFGETLETGGQNLFGIYGFYMYKIMHRFHVQGHAGFAGSRVLLNTSNQNSEFILTYNQTIFAGSKFFYTIAQSNNHQFRLYASPNFYFLNSSRIKAPSNQINHIKKGTNFGLSVGIQWFLD